MKSLSVLLLAASSNAWSSSLLRDFASALNISKIDNLGNVHPYTFWWDHNLGNVKERNFSEIWQDRSDPLMDGLKSQPRPLEGRCGKCNYLDVCGGNTSVRAYQLTGDFWAEDLAC